MAFIIPCLKCFWQDPIIEPKDKDAGSLTFRVWCLHCKWEGEVRIPVEYRTTNEGMYLKSV